MRAAVFQDPAAGIAIEEISVDPPRAGEIEVRMLAAGVCHSDLHTRAQPRSSRSARVSAAWRPAIAWCSRGTPHAATACAA
jgi:Zn-dependent alcohol dehydrogenase